MTRAIVPGALCCSLALSITGAAGAVIGIDNRHGYSADAFLASGSYFDRFREVITDAGHTIVPIDLFTAPNLAGLDGLIVTMGFSQNSGIYGPTEQAAIASFAGDRAVFLSDTNIWADDDTTSDRSIGFGDNERLLRNTVDFISRGGVVFMADTGTGFQPDNFNQLVSPWGVSYATSSTDGFGRTVNFIRSSPITAGVHTLGVDSQLPIRNFGVTEDLSAGTLNDDILAFIPAPAGSLALAGFGVALGGRRARPAV